MMARIEWLERDFEESELGPPFEWDEGIQDSVMWI